MHLRRAHRRRAAGRILLVALVATLAIPVRADAAARVLVVQRADTPRLVRTLAALREHSQLPVETIPASAPEESVRREWTRSDRGSVLVALGPRASDEIMKLGLPGPIVHCLAGPDALRAGLPAVPSEVPADQQAAWLAKLVPDAKAVGLLFDPAANTRRAQAHAAALGAAGFRALLQPVESPGALPAALDRVAARADVLLALPDGTVYTRESSRGLLLASFRKRVPLVGLNDAWVRMGALYALDWDYREVGAACAALAAGEAGPRNAPPVAAPRPRVSVNTKSASHFGITWNEGVLRQVDLRHE